VPTDPAKGFVHEGAGLTYIDHVTHNVFRGNMDQWAGFYEKLFNFREIRYFDIEGKLTGLKSRAMTSPDGKIRIPINESSDDKSQIAEYLDLYQGEGIQHIALGTDSDIYEFRRNAALKAASRSRTRPIPITSASTIASRAMARMSTA
jgi:4-hydroxyphenylpyruvate dioxygenase